MIVFESRKQRRVLVRLERGEDPVATLVELARAEKIRAAWVRGVGALAWAELDRHDPERGAPEPARRVEGACDALSLEGHVGLEGKTPAVRLHATLATDDGLVGGRLVRASSYAVELALEVFEDVRLERTEDAETGLVSWAGPSRPGVQVGEVGVEVEAPSRAWTKARNEDEGGGVSWGDVAAASERQLEAAEVGWGDVAAASAHEDAPAPSGKGGGVSWADVAAVSAAPEVDPPRAEKRRPPASRGPARPAFEPPPIPGRGGDAPRGNVYAPTKGDFVQHRQFGLCRIDRDDGAGGITLRLPSGVRKKIKLQYMEVGAPRQEGGKTVYPIRPRKR